MYRPADDANARKGKVSCVLRSKHQEHAPPEKRNHVLFVLAVLAGWPAGPNNILRIYLRFL
jgi:hypothetical protein